LLVSHDRYFISRVANRIVEIRDGEAGALPRRLRLFTAKKAEEGGTEPGGRHRSLQEAKKSAKREQESPRRQEARSKG